MARSASEYTLVVLRTSLSDGEAPFLRDEADELAEVMDEARARGGPRFTLCFACSVVMAALLARRTKPEIDRVAVNAALRAAAWAGAASVETERESFEAACARMEFSDALADLARAIAENSDPLLRA